MARKQKEFDLERFFVALSDKTRLRLLNILAEDEVCVCYFVEVLGEKQSKISRHLAYLRRAGIAAARREGKWVHYRITPPAEPLAARILDEVLSWLRKDKGMQRDRATLVKVCCAPCPPVQLLGAPKPARMGTRPGASFSIVNRDAP
jgi:ArsR family transcriptional regulator, arsenate/arsenite/antimonite-responsive transcriptional repressor